MEDDTWAALTAAFETRDGVTRSTMMRRPALAYRGKTLVFLARRHGPGIGARIGDIAPDALGLRYWGPLQPFKDKAPMRGWIISRPGDAALWPDITEVALRHAMQEEARENA